MHVRTDRKRLGDGTRRGYVSLAHNVWVEGPTGRKRAKPIIFAQLGREEDLDLGTVSSMRDAIDRYLKRRMEREGRSEEVVQEAAAKAQTVVPALRVLASREYGLRVLVAAAWKGMGLDQTLKRIARDRDIAFAFERVVFGMVLNRLVDPASKRFCNVWLNESA